MNKKEFFCICTKLNRLISSVIMCSMVMSVCSCSKNEGDFDGTRFASTRKISVLVDSVDAFDSGLTVDSSGTARLIHDSVLRDCNIDVSFVESDKLDIRYGICADISFSNDVSILNTYYRMNSIINIAPYLENNKSSLSDLIELLGDENIYSCTDDPSEIWYLSERNYDSDARVTFIRSDWLKKLSLEEPTTREELYKCLVAFKDNSELLLGDDASEMIPFFIDNDPGISAKPLFDSCLDTSIDDMGFYENGYCRVTQEGYKDGLEILNEWYLQGLLPGDYQSIRPNTKESYEPIENGYVGAFCAKYDYLYVNGDNSHINVLHNNCGDNADYIAVNTFENCYGEYTSWEEEYLFEGGNKIFIPSTCSDPLACLVYLNWISNADNIKAILNANSGDNNIDPFTGDRYLLTCTGVNHIADMVDGSPVEQAKQTASEVQYIQRGNKCVRYNTSVFVYINTEIDIENTYPDSTKNFICKVIGSADGDFERVYNEQYEEYLTYGAYWIVGIRAGEWDKVMVRGAMIPS